MPDDSDFEAFAEKIREAARGVNALILDSYLDVSKKASVPQAALDLDEFVGAVRHIQPRLGSKPNKSVAA